MRSLLLALLALPLPLTQTTASTLTVNKPCSDHGVFQHSSEIPLSGTATPGEIVTISFAGQSRSATTSSQGKWNVVLPAFKPGTQGDLEVQASTRLTIRHIQVGELWVCAGDATMSRDINGSRSSRAELTSKTFPNIRIFRAENRPASEPQTHLEGQWIVPDNASIKATAALPYLFAKSLQSHGDHAIGIIHVADPEPVAVLRGGKLTGSTIEAWISDDALRQLPEAAPLFDYYRSNSPMREALLEYEAALGDWKLKTGKAFGAELRELENREPDVWYDYLAEMRKAGKAAPADPPRKPTADSLRLAPSRPSNLWNALIAPIVHIPVQGIALHLGMANTPRATQAVGLLKTLIRDWRKSWHRDDLPFLLIQQTRANHPNLDPRAVSELREAQSTATRTLPKTALIPTLDLTGNITTDDLPTIATRMANSALALAKNQPTPSGPIIETVRFEAGKAIVQLKSFNLPLSSRDKGPIKGFAITAKPDRWAYADATLQDDRLIVSHPDIKDPVALRYDWVLEPGREGNLTDASGLPTLPFHSDDWPAFTNSPQAMRPNAVATIQPNDLYPVLNPALPRVLLIGDSIMNGYSPTVIEALKGKANIGRLVAFGMIGFNDASAAAFCAKLKDGDYAVIHYNDGLHSLPPRITDQQFGIGLTAMLTHLKTITPNVIWATTTPAPDRENTLGPDSHNGTVITRNEMSKTIAASAGIPVNDLYSLVIAERETLQGFANLHFTPEGSKRMGLQIARLIEQQLKKP